MNTIQKVKNFFGDILKKYFFIVNSSQTNAKVEPDSFMTGAEENCSLNFDEYREAYITRCRWS